MTDDATRVAIRSPQEIVGLGLAAMLARHPGQVRVEGRPDPAREPDVVVYDLAGLAAGSGSDLARLVTETTSAVLVVGDASRADLVARATSMGVDGFVPLDVDDAGLLAAVLATGKPAAPEPADDEDADPGPEPGRGGAVVHGGVGLTGREAEVLTLIVHGHSNQEIADRCFLSINSVKSYVRSAYRRIGVTTRSQAVVWCLQHGFEARPPRPARPGGGPGDDQIVATDPESTR